MASQSAESSIYEVFAIRSADGKRGVTVDRGSFRVVNFYYYENILSPHITGVATIVATTFVTTEVTLDRGTSLHAGLPLEVGGELFVKIKTEVGSEDSILDFSSTTDPHKRLYINEVQVLDRNSTSEVIQLRFTSGLGWLDTTTRVTRAFDGRISESVRSILRNELRLSDDKIMLSDTSNSYSFAGMTKRPFDLLGMLAKQSIPQNTANPGYFYYETQSGFKYLSADSLVTSEPYPNEYSYNGKNIATVESQSTENAFKIASLVVTKDQNLLSQIRSGVYANKTMFFNPATYHFTEIDISVDNDKLYKNPKFSTLGQEPNTPKILEDGFESGTTFHRVETAILNIGGDQENITPNNSPELYYAGSTTRYNLLFSQKHSITIPCNTQLEAGNTLTLMLESVSDEKELGPDQKQSGKYIIQSLCHYFDPEKSVTSIDLIRDSYGLHTSTSS